MYVNPTGIVQAHKTYEEVHISDTDKSVLITQESLLEKTPDQLLDLRKRLFPEKQEKLIKQEDLTVLEKCQEIIKNIQNTKGLTLGKIDKLNKLNEAIECYIKSYKTHETYKANLQKQQQEVQAQGAQGAALHDHLTILPRLSGHL